MRLRFGAFVLDHDQRRLEKNGSGIHLAPKAYDVLALLIAERPRVLAKDEIIAAVWTGVFVGDSTLATTIRDVRRALEDSADEPRYIRTVHGFGYAFVGEVTGDADDEGAASPWRLVYDGGEVALREGANIIGREGPGVLRIDAPTVSRQHARLTIATSGVTCEDLGSKNGTWVDTARVTAAARAGDGSEIRLGSVVVVLRCVMSATSTQTVTGRER